MKIELLHQRDPDSACTHRLWVDGVEVQEDVPTATPVAQLSGLDIHIETVDPGAGWDRAEWRQATDAVAAADQLTQAFRDAVVDARDEVAP